VTGVVLRNFMFLNLLEVRILLVDGLGVIDDPRILVRLLMPGKGRSSGAHRQQQHGNCKSLHGWNVARDESRG